MSETERQRRVGADSCTRGGGFRVQVVYPTLDVHGDLSWGRREDMGRAGGLLGCVGGR